ncbi:hypothetical protein QE152_g25065 [Popillia japonica]|uniref:Uncharacterized protein n=1 Tax=Popillia japonica TaxID=7064 RepID=A0AAW1K2S1_POPJA
MSCWIFLARSVGECNKSVSVYPNYLERYWIHPPFFRKSRWTAKWQTTFIYLAIISIMPRETTATNLPAISISP